MLITFKTSARCPNITMFGDVALQILKLMGRSETVPSAMEPEDILEALQLLRKGVAVADAAMEVQAVEDVDTEEERPVSLQNRALPLIELLEAAHKENVSVMWEQDKKMY